MNGTRIAGLLGILLGPAGLPRAVVTRLHGEVVKALTVPTVKERYAAQDADLVGSTPEEYAALLRNEVQRWAEVIKASGMTIDSQPGK